MTGRRISPYELERAIGSGGMREVWLARDLALGRPAAALLARARQAGAAERPRDPGAA